MMFFISIPLLILSIIYAYKIQKGNYFLDKVEQFIIIMVLIIYVIKDIILNI